MREILKLFLSSFTICFAIFNIAVESLVFVVVNMLLSHLSNVHTYSHVVLSFYKKCFNSLSLSCKGQIQWQYLSQLTKLYKTDM